MDDLTNDAKFLISAMYKEYLERRKIGKTKEEATNFQSEKVIAQEIMPEWKEADVNYTIAELKSHGFLDATAAGNAFMWVKMTSKAISALEVTFQDKVDSVLNFMAKIKDAIPFI